MKKDKLSYTALSQFDKSPNHLLAYWNKEFKATSEMKKGALGHLLILEPEQFEDKYKIYSGTRRGKLWDEFKALNDDKDIITIKEYNETNELVKTVKQNNLLIDLISSLDETEKHIEWQRFNVDFHGFIDGVNNDCIVDIKFCQDSGERFIRELEYNNHTLQASMYLDAFNYDRDYLLVAIEKNPPFNVSIYRLGWDMINTGKERYFNIVNRYIQWDGEPCGYSQTIIDL